MELDVKFCVRFKKMQIPHLKSQIEVGITTSWIVAFFLKYSEISHISYDHTYF